MSIQDVLKSFDKMQASLFGIRALMVKYQALTEGDAATVAGADKLIAQSKFALYEGNRLLGKDRSTAIKADNADGFVAGIASTDDMDLYRHRIMAGAFSESIRKRGLTGPSSIKLLLDHDSGRPAGVIKRLQYIGSRLEIDAQLAMEIEYVRDRHSAMRMIQGFNFSVGFILEDYEIKTDANKMEYLQINRGDLFEVSLVAFPGNEAATLTNIKQQPDHDSAIAKLNRIQGLLATLKGMEL